MTSIGPAIAMFAFIVSDYLISLDKTVEKPKRERKFCAVMAWMFLIITIVASIKDLAR